MSKKQLFFLFAWIGAALSIFGASAVKYAGLRFMTLAALLAAGSIVCILLASVFAIGVFKEGKSAASGFVLLGASLAPFLIDELLTLHGTPVNAHGFAVFGCILYFLISEALSVGLATAVADRLIQGKTKNIS